MAKNRNAANIPGVLDLSMYVLIKSGGGGDPTADIIVCGVLASAFQVSGVVWERWRDGKSTNRVGYPTGR